MGAQQTKPGYSKLQDRNSLYDSLVRHLKRGEPVDFCLRTRDAAKLLVARMHLTDIGAEWSDANVAVYHTYTDPVMSPGIITKMTGNKITVKGYVKYPSDFDCYILKLQAQADSSWIGTLDYLNMMTGSTEVVRSYPVTIYSEREYRLAQRFAYNHLTYLDPTVGPITQIVCKNNIYNFKDWNTSPRTINVVRDSSSDEEFNDQINKSYTLPLGECVAITLDDTQHDLPYSGLVGTNIDLPVVV